MQILELGEGDRQAWDEYVYASPHATFFHLAGWKDVVEHTLGLSSHYLMACNSSRVLGVLPLLHVKNRVSGPYFTSLPNAICAENDQAAFALIKQAIELVRDSKSRYLLLRDSVQRWEMPELVTDQSHCTLVASLGDNPDAMWQKLDRRVRQHVRKAEHSDLEVLVGPQHLEEVYPAYSKAMRDLGTPTLGLEFFQRMFSQFREHFTAVMVRSQGEVLGGAFVAQFRDTLYNTWGGMLRESFPLRSCHIWYWETLKYGHEKGFQWIDLGRSEWDSGTFQFKRHWLAEPKPLYHQFYLNGPSRPPALGSRRGQHLRYRVFVRAWKHLPVPMTERIGPFLRQGMPFG